MPYRVHAWTKYEQVYVSPSGRQFRQVFEYDIFRASFISDFWCYACYACYARYASRRILTFGIYSPFAHSHTQQLFVKSTCKKFVLGRTEWCWVKHGMDIQYDTDVNIYTYIYNTDRLVWEQETQSSQYVFRMLDVWYVVVTCVYLSTYR